MTIICLYCMIVNFKYLPLVLHLLFSLGDICFSSVSLVGCREPEMCIPLFCFCSADIHESMLATSYQLFTHLYFSLQVSYPANTNILYVDLQAVEEIGSRKNASCLPGMVLNLKKAVSYVDHLGFECRYLFPVIHLITC